MIRRESGQPISFQAQAKRPTTGVVKNAGSIAVRQQQGTPATVSPQFSGIQTRLMNASRDKMISIFGKISEVFLVAFLAQDVVGMWLPRVGVSLKRGRIHYDPENDPNAQHLPMKDKVKVWIKKNFKGLNWVNFTEEAGREFATGPGVLMIPTVMYAFARRAYGKSAVELGHAPLKELSQGFIDHLSKHNSAILNATVTKDNVTQFNQAFQRELKNYLVSMVDDEAFKSWDLQRRTSSALVSGENFEAYTKNFNSGKQWLENWFERYTDLVSKSSQAAKGTEKEILKHIDEEFHHLAEEMKTIVSEVYTKDVKLGQELEETLRKGVRKSANEFERSSLMKVDHIATKAAQEGAKPNSKALGTLMEELHRGKDYFAQVMREKVSGEAKGAKLTDVAKGVFDKIVARKGFFAASITLLAGVYLIELAKFVQSHDAYPGERPTGGAHHSASVTPASSNQQNTLNNTFNPQAISPALAQGGGHA